MLSLILIQAKKKLWLGRSIKVLRLTSFLLVVCVCLLFFFAYKTKARMEEVALEFGQEMMLFPGEGKEGVREIHFNGVKLFAKSRALALPQEEVLDLFETRCREKNAGMIKELRDLEHMAKKGDTNTYSTDMGRMFDGVMRSEEASRGFVSCIEAPKGSKSGMAALAKRARSFADSGNLSEVGFLRYIFTIPDDQADGALTFALSIWSEGELNLKTMFPPDGSDAGGEEIQGFPRPPGSARVISMSQKGADYRINSYVSTQDPIDIRSFYRRTFKEVEYLSDEFASEDALIFKDGDMIRAVILSPQEKGTHVTLLNTSDESLLPPGFNKSGT